MYLKEVVKVIRAELILPQKRETLFLAIYEGNGERVMYLNQWLRQFFGELYIRKRDKVINSKEGECFENIMVLACQTVLWSFIKFSVTRLPPF